MAAIVTEDAEPCSLSLSLYNGRMDSGLPPIAALRAAYRERAADPVEMTYAALSRANANAGRNTYISSDRDWTLNEARQLARRPDAAEQLPLFGIPVALKDCFDLEGFPTSIGSKFYAAHHGAAFRDSWVAARLRAAGAVITGKTHLHQLAYGITGENPDYGDCLQPTNASLLTGGSSSGSAAAVQEGSALAAIGTDTGGSVRLPAALSGLAGYRASLGVGNWRGGWHLSPTFDTIGWLFRELRDAPRLAEALFDLPAETPLTTQPKVGVLAGPLLEDCEPAVHSAMAEWQERLLAVGATLQPIAPAFWRGAWDIYAPIQAHEAAHLHAGHFDRFDPAIAARLEWGASVSEEAILELRARHVEFRTEMEQLFTQVDFVLAPATPVTRLVAGADHTDARARILRHTTPASLGGNPALVLPSSACGVQLMAARGNDRTLLRCAAQLGDALAAERS